MPVKRTIEQYLKIKAVNWSTLKEMVRSPLHYAHRLEHPREDSTGLARGRAVHTAVLEPELFAKEYVVFQGKTRRGKEWDEFEAIYSRDYTILKQEEYDKAWQCAARVWKHPEAAGLLRDARCEESLTWKDKLTGIKCKARLDGIGVGNTMFDLKTTGNVDARIFGNLAARMLYHGQLAMYRDGAKHTGDVFIIAAEAEPPYDVAVFQLGEDELLIGQELYQGLLQRVVDCTKAGEWPGKYPGIEALALPKYMYEDDSQEDGTAQIVEVA